MNREKNGMMKIAIMGTRGIPANYGGFETFAEQLSTRLVRFGHQVTVYCRRSNFDYDQLGKTYNGVKLVVLPSIRHKYLDTVSHTYLSLFHSLPRKYDVILICNSVNSSLSFLPRLFGTRVLLNVDGLEWQRAKWNFLGKLVYRVSEWLGTLFVDGIISDARVIQNYYRKRFQKDSVFIPYGAFLKKVETNGALKRFQLEPQEYFLYVSRFEPENNPLLVVKAFEQTRIDKKLVMVGDAPFNERYIQNVKATRDPRIIFTGYVFGEAYKELQSNAFAYIQATEVGGTHPALLEGMGFGNCILAHDVPEHREVLGEAGIYFKKNPHHLAKKLEEVAHMSEERIQHYRKMAWQRIVSHYRWESVADQYEMLFRRVVHHLKS